MLIRQTSLSPSLHPTRLKPGADLVLHLDEAQSWDLPLGVAADDYLDAQTRREVDETAVDALTSWRNACDEALTVDGVCLPFVNECSLMRLLVGTLRAVAGLGAALERHRPAELRLAPCDDLTLGVVQAVAARAGLAVSRQPGDPPVASQAVQRAPKPLSQRVRQRTVRALLRLGAPTMLRRRSVLVLSYWPLLPLLDRLLDDPQIRVAIPLEKRPAGPGRSLRAIADGGWLGRPGPVSVARARRRLLPAMKGAQELAPAKLVAFGCDLGPALHAAMLGVAVEAAAVQLATAAVIRRAYRLRPPALILTTYDTEPFPRLAVSLAREAGISSFVLAHGAFLMPQTLKDMELADEAAIYSEAVGFPGMRRDRPVHVVGYPLPHVHAPERRAPAVRAPHIVVLGQNGHPYTSRFDERIALRHYVSALEALREVIPEAQVVLRPHPSQNLNPVHATIDRFTAIEARIDATTPIDELLRSTDLCIGSLSTATLQAALAGAAVAVLNVSGFDWRWPLGGQTPVPVACDAEQLAEVLRTWRRDGSLPGNAALLEALGTDRPGTVERLKGLVASAAGPTGD